jgi:hypothetical protein
MMKQLKQVKQVKQGLPWTSWTCQSNNPSTAAAGPDDTIVNKRSPRRPRAMVPQGDINFRLLIFPGFHIIIRYTVYTGILYTVVYTVKYFYRTRQKYYLLLGIATLLYYCTHIIIIIIIM